jgi:hypothetical protein
MSFRIVFLEWIDVTKISLPSRQRPWLISQFQIDEEGEYLFLVNVSVHKGPETLKYRDSEEEFKDALLCYSVRRIEDALRTESFLIKPANGVQEIHIETEYLLFIDKLIQDKTCFYQIREERGLFCSAGNLNDLTKEYNPMRRSVTSHAICRACDLPNTDYICSNLSHPAIMVHQLMGTQFARIAMSGLCGRGEPGAENAPSQCRPGGHRCWERILEPEIEAPEIPSLSLALPEAFDYLDAVWRNAMRANHALFRLTTVSGMAQLA